MDEGIQERIGARCVERLAAKARATDVPGVDERPTCPYCKETMVRAHWELEDGWRVFWLCGCEPEPMTVADLEAAKEWVPYVPPKSTCPDTPDEPFMAGTGWHVDFWTDDEAKALDWLGNESEWTQAAPATDGRRTP